MIQRASAYTVTSFDAPGAVNGTAGVAINDAGEVAGFGVDSNFNYQPFVEHNGTITTFEVPGATYGINGQVYINNAGEVAGTYGDSNGNTDGFVEHHGTVTTLDGPGAMDTVLDGINNSGEVLGAYLDSNFNEHDFVEKHGSFTNLSLPAGASLFFVPAAINDAGTVAGAINSDQFGQNPLQVFIDHAGKITTFELTPQPANLEQLFINDRGEVTGTYYSSATGSQSFLYDKGTVTSIPGASLVLGINNAGQVIGQYSPNGSELGFVYSHGTFTSIAPPGSTFTTPLGINDSGEITGAWFDSNGNEHGFFATPTCAVTRTSTSNDLSTGNLFAGNGSDNLSGVPLSELLGSAHAADLLPEFGMRASSPSAALSHFASGTASGALTYPDASTVVMPDLHGGGN